MKPIDYFDILIVGGGLVGASLALSLADQPLKIGIVEASATPPKDKRALGLSPSSLKIFEKLQLSLQPWLSPIAEIRVSDAGHFGATRFSAKDLNLAALGQVIESAILLDIIRNKVLNNAAITWMCPATVTQIQPAGGSHRLLVKSSNEERSITARLLVAADGNHSTIRQLLAIPSKTYRYGQHAIVTRIKLEKPHQAIAYERFTKEGAIAALPLANSEYAIIWVMNSTQAEKIVKFPTPDFMSALQHTWGYHLGRIASVEMPLQSFPLVRIDAQEQVRSGIVLLGNAAHNLHPVAAQGLNLSLRDTAGLAECIRQAIKSAQDFSSRTVLNDYVKSRQRDQRETMTFTHGLKSIFNSDLLPVVWGRNLGLTGLNILPPLKKLFAYQAMGFR